MLINSQIVECTVADLPLATAASKTHFTESQTWVQAVLYL